MLNFNVYATDNTWVVFILFHLFMKLIEKLLSLILTETDMKTVSIVQPKISSERDKDGTVFLLSFFLYQQLTFLSYFQKTFQFN